MTKNNNIELVLKQQNMIDSCSECPIITYEIVKKLGFEKDKSLPNITDKVVSDIVKQVSVSNYMLDDDDTYSVREEPNESLTCKTKKRKNRENHNIKYAHDSSTGNMLGHLWSKHRINKDHLEETTTDSPIIKAIHVINKRRQEKIAQLLVKFIIDNCQPLHILLKKMIDKAYDWSRDQLFGMMNISSGFIHKRNVDIQKFIKQLMMYRQDKTLHIWPGFDLKKSERCDRLDGKYLKLITLTENEWQLLDGLISLLKPFYEATNIFSDSSYLSLNLIYPTMKLLIKGQSQPIDNEGPDELDIENEFDILYNGKNRKDTNLYNDPRFKGHRLIEPPVTTEELCDLVKAASYLSLQKYWKVSEEIGLIALFLDLRIKNLKFLNNETMKTTTINRVRILCDKGNNHPPLVGPDKSSSMLTYEPTTNNDLIVALYNSEEPDDEILNEGEVDHYLHEPVEKMGCNPLVW
ncbi:28278_t:CDS:2 [Dentiscutata erythropus]|uniref:28278_t:CDS:1 n=1 Tax=Dentiscutata erythropus TaxID=1348616 RepID=A0A9N9HCY0_9GLOM|nr:28278_t:CDS:2 [Dentiscutata erythropus]